MEKAECVFPSGTKTKNICFKRMAAQDQIGKTPQRNQPEVTVNDLNLS